MFRLISQVVLNAHKVYQKVTGQFKFTFLQFLCDVILHLLTQSELPDPTVRQDDSYTRLTGRHFPSIKKAAPDANDQRPTKPCRVCTAQKQKTLKGKALKTIYICKQYPSEPGLHPSPCFEKYHTMLDFSEQDD